MFITDGDGVTPAELAAYDPEVLTLQPITQQQGGVPLVGPESVIRLSAENACRMIGAAFQNFSGYLMSPGNSANQVAAVMNVYSTSVTRMRMRLNQVIVEEPDITKRYLKDYIKFYALYLFFQSMFHRKASKDSGDRYEIKMNHYENEAKKAWQRLEAAGLPITLVPLACPGAIREYRAGTWDDSNVTVGASGSSETGNEYDVAITYVGPGYTSWAAPNNAESAPSTTVTVQPTAGQVITVSIATLNPPNGTVPLIGTSDGIYSPMQAVGWLIYASPSGKTMVLQNSSPIPIATTSYTLPDAPVVNGQTVGVGLYADYNYSFMRVISRA